MKKLSKKEVRMFSYPKCGVEFEVCETPNNFNKGKYKKFCSRKCSNSRTWADADKALKRKRALEHYDVVGRIPMENRNCETCGKEFEIKKSSLKRFCIPTCIQKDETVKQKVRNGGLKSAQTQSINRRSKNEKYFAELCSNHFKNVLTNEPTFNGWDVDVIIEDIKTAVLWNGKWHYEKITEKHSVKKIQNRDKIKVKEIKRAGYTPYIIKDMGKYNKEFQKFIAG